MRWDWLSRLLDVLYPRACAGCGERVDPDPGHICWECMAETQYIALPYCSLCGDPIDGQVDDSFICYQCSRATPSFDKARSATRYRGPLRTILHQFKYNNSVWLRRDLARILELCVAAHYSPDDIDAVCFVPLHPLRQRERGYNQAELLARSLARRIRKPLLRRCLFRVKPTSTQTNLTAKERATNVRGAFRAGWSRWIEGRRILLVDDVMTTGATVNECARILKDSGAGRVYVVTVARG